MRIKHLINNTYQIVNEEDTDTIYQGTLQECEVYLNLYELKDNPFLKEFLNLFKKNSNE